MSRSNVAELPPWLARARDEFAADASRERLHHAWLIHCPDGWGAMLLAASFVRTALGLQTDEQTDESPGEEPARRAHPDLHWLESDVERSTIRVDEIRELNDFLIGFPQLAPRKVAVVIDAERMNVNAANALLKSLEEPAENCHLILTTSRPQRLPATIRSRCRRLQIAADYPAAAGWLGSPWDAGTLRECCVGPVTLKREASADEVTAEEANPLRAALAAGDAGAVLQWLQQEPALAARQWLVQTRDGVRNAMEASPSDPQRARRLLSFADELIHFLDQLDVPGTNVPLQCQLLLTRWAQTGTQS